MSGMANAFPYKMRIGLITRRGSGCGVKIKFTDVPMYALHLPYVVRNTLWLTL